MQNKLRYGLAGVWLAGTGALGFYNALPVLQEHGYFLPDHVVLLHGDLTEENTDNFILAFNEAVGNYDGETSLIVRINSPGGYYIEGERIIEAIEQADVPITLRCENLAASMAAQILITTQNVKRDVSENCAIMLHSPHISEENGPTKTLDFLYEYQDYLLSVSDEYINSEDLTDQFFFYMQWRTTRLDIAFLEDLSEQLASELAESSNLTTEDFLYFFSTGDRYFYPYTAGAFGFIDTIEGQAVPENTLSDALRFTCITDPELSVCQSELETFPYQLPEF